MSACIYYFDNIKIYFKTILRIYLFYVLISLMKQVCFLYIYHFFSKILI
jgi:hypothetical protein